jgi:hypothetical protein
LGLLGYLWESVAYTPGALLSFGGVWRGERRQSSYLRRQPLDAAVGQVQVGR